MQYIVLHCNALRNGIFCITLLEDNLPLFTIRPHCKIALFCNVLCYIVRGYMPLLWNSLHCIALQDCTILHYIVFHCESGLSAIALEFTAAEVSGHLSWREGKHLKLRKFNLNLLLTARRHVGGWGDLCAKQTFTENCVRGTLRCVENA